MIPWWKVVCWCGCCSSWLAAFAAADRTLLLLVQTTLLAVRNSRGLEFSSVPKQPGKAVLTMQLCASAGAARGGTHIGKDVSVHARTWAAWHERA